MEKVDVKYGKCLQTCAPQSRDIAGTLMDSIGSGVVFIDKGRRLALVNRKAEAILQIDADAVIGKRVDMLPLRTPIYKVLSEDSRGVAVEMSINGAIVAVKSSELRIGDDEELLGEIFELRDISEAKKEKREREEFVAMMTHDLKSPLTVLMGYVQSLKVEVPEKVDRSLEPYLEELDRSSYKLLHMIEDVLDAYRLEVGLLQTDCASCEIGPLLEVCCRDGMREASTRGSTLTYRIMDGIPPLKVDRKQIARVFANLIGNALKFTPRRGRVTVTADMLDNNVLIAVSDTGIGIPQKDLPRVFNKYFRSTIATGFKGTGLGLTITKAIVEAHGGKIDVESVEGAGSCFKVTIPIVPMAEKL